MAPFVMTWHAIYGIHRAAVSIAVNARHQRSVVMRFASPSTACWIDFSRTPSANRRLRLGDFDIWGPGRRPRFDLLGSALDFCAGPPSRWPAPIGEWGGGRGLATKI